MGKINAPRPIEGAEMTRMRGVMQPEQEKKWRDRKPPRDEDVVLLAIIPWNLTDHGDVIPEKKQWLFENFRRVYRVFEEASFPTIHSLQGNDLDGLEECDSFTRVEFETLPHMGAPYDHLLCGMLGKVAKGHVRRMVQEGVQCNAVGDDGEELYFCPEWDVFRKPEYYFPGKKMVFPSVGRFAVEYSDCTVGDNADREVMGHECLRIGNHLVPIMKGVDDFHRAWFAFQLDDSEANLATVVQSVRDIVENRNNAGKVVSLFMDGESVLVGGARSFWNEYPLKGYELWARFFGALAEAGLDRYFHGPERAYPRWNRLADDLSGDKLLGRKYPKWGGELEQEELKATYDSLPGEDKGFCDHVKAARRSTSDALSVHRTKQDAKPRIFRDKDGVEFTLDYDHVIPLVAYEAGESLNGGGSFVRRLEKASKHAAEKFARDGKPFGNGERFMIGLHAKVYLRHENRVIG